MKKVSGFPVSSQDVTYQTLPGRELLNYSRVWKVTSWLGTGKPLIFFYSVPAASYAKTLPQFVRIVPGGSGAGLLYIHDSDSGVVLIRCAGLGAAPPQEG